jgi:DNA (cytosine-5)-methyltransferase 1
MKSVVKYYTIGEFFSGPGGLALGAISSASNNGKETLKIKHEWANDYDNDSCLTFKHNICKNDKIDSVICCDIRKLDITKLRPVDIFAYGFPCNDFSIVGEQKGFNGDFGPLYKYGVAILDTMKPKVFVAENVGGIASSNEGTAFKKILWDLSSAGNGYNVTAHLYKAEDYGVPQTRHRYIIVGFDKKLGVEFKVPKTNT